MFGLTRQELLDLVQTITIGLLAVYVLWLDIQTRKWLNVIVCHLIKQKIASDLQEWLNTRTEEDEEV
jgi:hypothetical protein